MSIRNAAAVLLGTALLVFASPALAQDTVKIGMVAPMTGTFASTGRQLVAGARLYMSLNGDVVAGKKVELIVKDDSANPEVTKVPGRKLTTHGIVMEDAGACTGTNLTGWL